MLKYTTKYPTKLESFIIMIPIGYWHYLFLCKEDYRQRSRTCTDFSFIVRVEANLLLDSINIWSRRLVLLTSQLDWTYMVVHKQGKHDNQIHDRLIRIVALI